MSFGHRDSGTKPTSSRDAWQLEVKEELPVTPVARTAKAFKQSSFNKEARSPVPTDVLEINSWYSDVCWLSSFRAHQSCTLLKRSIRKSRAGNRIYIFQLRRAVVNQNRSKGENYWQDCFQNSNFLPRTSKPRIWLISSTTTLASSLLSFARVDALPLSECKAEMPAARDVLC